MKIKTIIIFFRHPGGNKIAALRAREQVVINSAENSIRDKTRDTDRIITYRDTEQKRK